MKRVSQGPDQKTGALFCGAPCMGNNLAVEVRYALGSRER